MGLLKSLVSVVETAVVVAAVATGAGAIAAGITGAISTVSFASVFITSAVLGGLSMALAKKPTQAAIQARLVSTRQAIAPWRIIYGKVRVGGTITFIWTDGHWLHMIITLAGHACQEIGDIYFNDELVPIDGGTSGATGKYAGYAWVRKSLGDEVGTPAWCTWLSGVTGNVWTTAHLQSGRTKIIVSLSKSTDIFPQGIPNITAVVKGRKVYDPRGPSTAWTQNAALCVCDYLTNASFGYAADYSTEIDSAALIAAANACDEAVSLKVGTGTGYVTSGSYSIGAVAITLTSGSGTIIAGDEIQFVGDATTYYVAAPLTAGVVTLARGLVVAISTPVAVTLHSPTSESRYCVNGAFTTDQAPKDVMANLIAQMSGKAVSAGDRWYIFAGKYEAPTLTLTETDMSGQISVQSLVARRDSCNGVKGVFVDPFNGWQACDFPPVASNTYMAQDGGQRIWKDIDLTAFCTSGTQAQRLAKIELLKTRQGLTASLTCKLTAYAAMTGHTVAITSDKFGWAAKPFDVVSSSFAILPDQSGGATLGVQLGLRETAAAIYDWSTDDESAVDIAPNTNLPDPWSAPVPTALVVATAIYDQRGLVVTFSWTSPGSPFVQEYAPHYRVSGGTWIDLPKVGIATTCEIVGLSDSVAYEFAVASVNIFGVKGADASITQTVHAPMLTDPTAAKIWSETDPNGNLTRIRVQATFTGLDTNRPDGLLVMYSHDKYENSARVVSGDTTTTLLLDMINIYNGSVYYPDSEQPIIKSGSTSSYIIIRDPTYPLPENAEYPWHLWVNVGRGPSGEDAEWHQCSAYDATGFYLDTPFSFTPVVGNIMHWVEGGFVDQRGSGVPTDFGPSNRLMILEDGANYEIIRWSSFFYVPGGDGSGYGGYNGLHIACAERGAEGTSGSIINADMKYLHYFPAPGPGTTQFEIPTSAFVSTDNGVTYTAEIDQSLNIAAGEFASFSCCTFRRGKTNVVRSHIVPMTYGGAV